MALLPSPSSGSGKDKHEESPSDTNTRNKNAGASSSNALENRAGNEAKVADDGSEEDSDGDVDIEESDAEANHLESDDDGEVAAPEANDEPWYLAAMIWERPAKGVDIFCFDPDLSVAWYLETVLWVDSFSQPKIHFLSIPYTEDDVVLELRSNLGLVLRHFDVTSVEVWKPDIYTWVEQSVTTPIHVHGQDDKLLLLRLPDVGYCQGFLKFFERMECDQTGSDVMANALQRDGGFSWQEKGKGVDRGDNR
ncbi:hypothetical protein BD309DRAFT_878922 [Dichomitus squalens]|nr:hypothetical protein BD309DRAFT_878922 [Dichomitus squalens]